VDREPDISNFGAGLSISGGSPIIPPENSFAPGSDEGFQKLLVRIASKRANGPARIP